MVPGRGWLNVCGLTFIQSRTETKGETMGKYVMAFKGGGIPQTEEEQKTRHGCVDRVVHGPR